MPIHHRIVTHVQKHQKKYIFGAWLLSWLGVMKIVAVMLVSFGIANMNWTLAGDYMDAEYYEMMANSGGAIPIAVDTALPSLSTWNLSPLTWTNFTWINSSWVIK